MALPAALPRTCGLVRLPLAGVSWLLTVCSHFLVHVSASPISSCSCHLSVRPLNCDLHSGVACSLTSPSWLLVRLLMIGVPWLLSVCPNSLVVHVSASPISTVVFSVSSFHVDSSLSVIFICGVACSLTSPLWLLVRLPLADISRLLQSVYTFSCASVSETYFFGRFL